MARRQVSRRRRIKKNIENGVTHIRSTFDNIIITITDEFGNTLPWSSADTLGFKGSEKSAPFAAQMVSGTASESTMEHGLGAVEAAVKEPGPGREPTIRTLRSAGLEVIAIRDVIPVPHNSCRPSKHRRV